MLQLTPVSKCKKQKWAQNRKTKQELFKQSKLQFVKLNDDGQIYPDEPLADKYHNFPYKDRFFENSSMTKFIHQKVISLKLSMMVLGVLSIILSLNKYSLYQNEIIKRYVLIFQSLNTLSLIILLILQHIFKKQLKEKQLIQTSVPKSRQILRNLFLEAGLLIIHPNLLTQSINIYIPQPIYGLYNQQHLNNIFQIIMLLRVYLIYNALIYSTKYCSTRASRVCRMYSTKTNGIYGVKCLFNSCPLVFLFTLFITLLIIYGQMLRLSQSSSNNGLQQLGNSLWCVVITMGTIGYGDYFPLTYIGRIIAFLSAISGIILTSLLILTLSKYLTMGVAENKSHITLKRLQLRQLLQRYASETFMLTTSMLKLNSNSNTSVFLNELKKKTQNVRITMRRIKNMVDHDDINQEMSRLFQVLTDNLKEIYMNQLNYSKLLNKLYQYEVRNIENLKFSFTKEIQDIIKDR